ncbi:MAG: porphobilinogen synthase [Elusimicrobia bacterium]|nr:porphobilinogen synthase [Elusimicrobiota bacterium]
MPLKTAPRQTTPSNRRPDFAVAQRPRRLRRTPALRAMVQETRLAKDQLMAPLFVREGPESKTVGQLPNHPQRCLSDLLRHLETFVKKGGRSVILFGIPDNKNPEATGAWHEKGIIQNAVRAIKKSFGDELVVAADLCFCEYTDHGHCGVLTGERVDNDATLELIAKTAASLAQAGADIVAPSAMMDAQVATIRQSLDRNNFKETIILSYAAKYASTMYGPFRELAQSTPGFGDRKSYQMNPANAEEALREIRLDIEQGADMVMVKPALPYLDIIARAKQTFSHPMAAFQVSGEAWMLEQYAQSGMARRQDVLMESLLSIRRAGADLIISYFTEEVLSLL